MKITTLKCIALALPLLALAPHARAQTGPATSPATNPTPKMETVTIDSEPGLQAFVEAYIAAINAKDAGKIKAMCHPVFLAAFKKFMEDTPAAPGQAKPTLDAALLQMNTLSPVPENHTPFVVQRYLKDSPLPMADVLDWPVPPTHTIQFSYNTSPHDVVDFTLHVAHLDNRWFVVGGIPNAEFMKKMRGGK